MDIFIPFITKFNNDEINKIWTTYFVGIALRNFTATSSFNNDRIMIHLYGKANNHKAKWEETVDYSSRVKPEAHKWLQ